MLTVLRTRLLQLPHQQMCSFIVLRAGDKPALRQQVGSTNSHHGYYSGRRDIW